VSQGSGEMLSQNIIQHEQRQYWMHHLGLDLPVFYFSLHSLAEPDTLYKISNKYERKIITSNIIASQSKWKRYVPVISFHANNQFHHWLFGDGGITSRGILRGDFGTSYLTKQPISEVIGEKMGWSLL